MEFWKSRTFWTLAVMFVLNLLAELGKIDIGEIQNYANIVLTVLAFIFRWQASGPLSAKQ